MEVLKIITLKQTTSTPRVGFTRVMGDDHCCDTLNMLRYLVFPLFIKFDMAQIKSKEFIYEKTIQNSKKSDRVQENSEKPGAQEVSQ